LTGIYNLAAESKGLAAFCNPPLPISTSPYFNQAWFTYARVLLEPLSLSMPGSGPQEKAAHH
jgi:hypothetical protein